MKKYTDKGKKDTRSGFGAGLYEAGKADANVVALTADLKGSLKMEAFADAFPERYYECGIAEANMVGAAAGLAIGGKIPFVGSFAEFVTGRSPTFFLNSETMQLSTDCPCLGIITTCAIKL